MNEYKTTCYHGTFYENVDRISKEGFIIKDHKDTDNHWLGHGIYFFEYYNLALSWTDCKVKSCKKKYGANYQSAVIEVVITEDKTKVANLDDSAELDKFIDFQTEWLREIKDIKLINFTEGIDKSKIGSYEFENKVSGRMRCMCFDYFKETKEISVIIYSFHKKNPSYAKVDRTISYGIFFLDYTEKQICASNNECIKSKYCCYPKEEYI